MKINLKIYIFVSWRTNFYSSFNGGCRQNVAQQWASCFPLMIWELRYLWTYIDGFHVSCWRKAFTSNIIVLHIIHFRPTFDFGFHGCNWPATYILSQHDITKDIKIRCKLQFAKQYETSKKNRRVKSTHQLAFPKCCFSKKKYSFFLSFFFYFIWFTISTQIAHFFSLA